MFVDVSCLLGTDNKGIFVKLMFRLARFCKFTTKDGMSAKQHTFTEGIKISHCPERLTQNEMIVLFIFVNSKKLNYLAQIINLYLLSWTLYECMVL